jgi:hypothetical protein
VPHSCARRVGTLFIGSSRKSKAKDGAPAGEGSRLGESDDCSEIPVG